MWNLSGTEFWVRGALRPSLIARLRPRARRNTVVAIWQLKPNSLGVDFAQKLVAGQDIAVVHLDVTERLPVLARPERLLRE